MFCDICGNKAKILLPIRGAQQKLCVTCAGGNNLHYCEICGSISLDGNPESQLHFEEDCFK